METPENKKLSRRDMLKLTSVILAGATVAACGSPKETTTVEPTKEQVVVPTKEQVVVPTEEQKVEPTEVIKEEPTAAPPATEPEGNVVVMHFLHEFTQDMADQFTAEHPKITVELVDAGADLSKFYAMTAAGTPPDLVRIQAPSVPGFVARNLVLDLTPYFMTSTMLKPDDLMPANDYYKAVSALEIGKGNIYGMVKDFSPDFTVFAYKKLFEDAGLPVPDDTQALTYAQVADLGSKLIKFEGDRQLVIGYNYEQGWIDRIWMNCLAETEQSLYTEGYDKIILTASEDATAIAKYFYDLGLNKIASSSINPSPNGWFGTDFTAGILGMAQYGFWFSAMANDGAVVDNIMMLPGLTWTGVRRDPTMTATGMVASSATKVPDATWLVFEYYNGGQPAIDRAMSGWGVPGLKSMLDLIPQTTDFQKQANKVLLGELALSSTPLQFNPFIGESAVSTSWSKNIDQALRGEIDFATALANVEAEVNQAIKDGVNAMLG